MCKLAYNTNAVGALSGFGTVGRDPRVHSIDEWVKTIFQNEIDNFHEQW